LFNEDEVAIVTYVAIQ